MLTIVRPGADTPLAATDERVMSLDDFWRWAKSGRIAGAMGRFEAARILVRRLETAGRPLPLALAARAVSRGSVFLEDAEGRRRMLDAGTLARWSGALATEPFRIPSLIRRAERTLEDLERPRTSAVDFNQSGTPVYLRTDLSFGVRAGGSVGHIAGVLNELARAAGGAVFLTTDAVPTLHQSVETRLIPPAEAFWNFRELPTLPLNDAFIAESRRALSGRSVSLLYQRYSLNNFAGLQIARELCVPLVLEYNGSEAWMARHWGRPLKYEELSSRVELACLRGADLIVVVSKAMRDEVVARGVPLDRIIICPNGVDTAMYSPAVDGSAVRRQLGFGVDEVVVGFIGTFGPWHGAETLAHAFVKLLHDAPALRTKLRLLLIGDGARRVATAGILERGGVLDRSVFVGLVPQEEGPAYLAACDLLASPHVPNPDGTPFFGSPTKLFEYMAMGKPIVASALEQIAEMLEHRRTAWLVPPGDVAALANGIDRLVSDDKLRQTLGTAARADALAHHTWRARVAQILDRVATAAAPTA